jgi:hypothetical protein
MEKETLSRKGLYDLVWSEPILSLSKKYEVSDYRLRKICKDLNIPLPRAGYWQKVEHNKRTSKKPLPLEFKGDESIEFCKRGEGNAKVAALSHLNSLIKEIKENPKLPLNVPKKLNHPEKLILEAKATLTSGKRKYPLFSEMVCTLDGQLNIRVTPKNVDRALRFMNSLIKLLKARNNNIKVDSRGTFVIIDNEQLEILLKEKMKIVPSQDRWSSQQYQSSGRLALQLVKIDSKDWEDGKLAIEEQLPSILAKLEIEAKKRKERAIERAVWQQQYEERLRVERELKERKEKEAEAFKSLLKHSEQWQQTKILREYIHEVEKRALENGGLSENLQSWLKWAKQKADFQDPLNKAEETLLSDFIAFKSGFV